jgi:hypothetical protein
MGAPYALSSDLVSAWPAKSLEVAQYIDGQLPLIAMTQNAQTGTTYTLAATDFTKLVTLSNASPVTVTVPLESSVAWVAGTQLRLMNLGAGVVTVAGAVGVTINGSPLTLAQYKQGTLTKTGTNIWTFVGSPSAPGMDLITPTSVAGSGVTLSGGQVTFTAATAVSVNGCFSATYDNYLMSITYSMASIVGQPWLQARMRAAGTDATGANYAYTLSQSSTSLSVSTSNFADTTARVARSGDVAAGLCGGTLQILSPFLAQRTAIVTDHSVSYSNTAIPRYFGAADHSLATSYDGVTIYPSASTITGTLRIYGLRN